MTREQVLRLLATEDRAVEKGILFLHSEQTADERSAGVTRESNGRGFNALSASFGSSLAEWIGKGRKLTPKQVVGGRKICVRHVRQLVAESERRLQAATVQVVEGSLATLDPFQG